MLFAAASLMVYTWSPSHPMHSAPSFSFSKNCVPSCDARSGMYSMIAILTLQCLSSASSTMAGSSDLDSRSMPITLFTSSSLLMMDRRTSGNSSLSSWRKMGRRCSMVAALPR